MDAIVGGVDRDLVVFLNGVKYALAEMDLVGGDQLEEDFVQLGSRHDVVVVSSAK